MTKRLVFTALLSLLLCVSWAQEGSYYTSGLEKFRKGVELFDKEKYASSRDVFDDFLESKPQKQDKLTVEAHYYRALCAVELFNNDAEFLLSHFLVQFPESPRVKELYFVMGNFQYRKKKYNKAIKWYKKVDTFKLETEQREEYQFKMGYSYFMRDKTEFASKHFIKIKDGESKYAVPAKYFYAHIAFDEKKYETALKAFKTLEQDDLFGPIVPYYIIQIYYYQKNNEAVVSYAPLLLDSLNTRRIPEISRILGEAYYKTERFEQAIPFLLKYKEKTEDFTRADMYQLAYAYYRVNNFQSAADQFEEVHKRKDSISHNAFYHLADCYLKLNEKEKAMSAFQQAAKLKVIPDVQEDAMYNYAKLSYEISDSPFHSAIKAIKDYLKAYPKSKHHDEAYSYLSKVFLSTKNYQLAIETIEEIGNKTPEVTESYQRVTYFRALERFTDKEYSKALRLFDKSIANSKYDLKTRALAKYWRAESLYRVKAYGKSFDGFNDFVLTSGAFGSEEYKDAHYNMGYALFKLHDYTKAIVWFRKYTEFTQSQKLSKMSDAYNRIGDCYFISKNYHFAIDYYDKSIEIKRNKVDYALFQKAFSLGLLKKHTEEIQDLQDLIQNYPNSSYLDDAIYEMANAYKYINSNDAATEQYTKIIKQFPNSEYRAKAFLQAGQLHYNNSKNDQALMNFKSLITDYPKSTEARNALLIMKNIYIEMNEVDAYIEFANNNAVETEVTKIEADSLTYITAENLYMEGDCEQSVPGFIKYINKYPDGRYLLNAHFYKSDCEFGKKAYQSALTSYDYIVNQAANEYTEDALVKAAYITSNAGDYERSAELYQQLLSNSNNNKSLKTAKIGLMRSEFKLKDYNKSIPSAMRVLTMTDVSKALEREVHYVIATSFLKTGDQEGAYTEYMLIADQAKSKEGAEANYRMIQIDFDRNDFDKAIEQITALRKANSPHQKWVGRSFIVLADIYKEKDNIFQAKYTLTSIIDNYRNKEDGVIKLAEEKFNDLIELEIDEQELDQAIDLEINLNDEEYNQLFEEEDPIKTDELPNLDTESDEGYLDEDSGPVIESAEPVFESAEPELKEEMPVKTDTVVTAPINSEIETEAEENLDTPEVKTETEETPEAQSEEPAEEPTEQEAEQEVENPADKVTEGLEEDLQGQTEATETETPTVGLVKPALEEEKEELQEQVEEQTEDVPDIEPEAIPGTNTSIESLKEGSPTELEKPETETEETQTELTPETKSEGESEGESEGNAEEILEEQEKKQTEEVLQGQSTPEKTEEVNDEN